jgi:hypothetical protein
VFVNSKVVGLAPGVIPTIVGSKRRRCKNLQRHEHPSAFVKQKYFLPVEKKQMKKAVAYYNAGVN